MTRASYQIRRYPSAEDRGVPLALIIHVRIVGSQTVSLEACRQFLSSSSPGTWKYRWQCNCMCLIMPGGARLHSSDLVKAHVLQIRSLSHLGDLDVGTVRQT